MLYNTNTSLYMHRPSQSPFPCPKQSTGRICIAKRVSYVVFIQLEKVTSALCDDSTNIPKQHQILHIHLLFYLDNGNFSKIFSGNYIKKKITRQVARLCFPSCSKISVMLIAFCQGLDYVFTSSMHLASPTKISTTSHNFTLDIFKL